MKYHAPTTIDAKNLDDVAAEAKKFDAAQAKYEADPKKNLFMSDLKYENRIFRVALTGETSADGIYANKFVDAEGKEGPEKYSIGIQLDEPSMELLLNLESELRTSAANLQYAVGDILKNEILYLKLKDKKGHFTFKSNIKMSPGTVNKVVVNRGSPVTANVSIFTYYDLAKETCGLGIKLEELNVEE